MSAEELARTCFQGGDESAWLEFIRRFNPLIASVALRVARQCGEASPQVIDDLMQETYLKLCSERIHILEKFRPDHPNAIYGFIKVFTLNLAQDHFKASRAQKRGGSVETSSLDADASADRIMRPEPAAAVFERELLLGQVDGCLKAVATGPNAGRDSRIFWLYYRVGLSASAIARLPTIELTTKGVESTILRLTKEVRQKLVLPKREEPAADKTSEGTRPAESF
jgi:RNA polymerase sigma-70 factor (ECF subfamily)